jgi:hypothetical protein
VRFNCLIRDDIRSGETSFNSDAMLYFAEVVIDLDMVEANDCRSRC